MKKALLLTGTILSLGVLTGCGGKAAKDIDLSVKEMDEKFDIPAGLTQIDNEFGDYVVDTVLSSVEHGLAKEQVPSQSVYEKVYNVNAAMKTKGAYFDGLGHAMSTDEKISEDVVYTKGDRVPIDTLTRYRKNITQTVSLYDNYITDYKISEDNHYIDERGHNLNYSNKNEQDNYWYEKEGEGTSSAYKIKQYNKATKQSGEGEFVYTADVKKGYKTEDEAKTAVRNVISNLTSQMFMDVYQMRLSYTNILDASVTLDIEIPSYFDPQIAYYSSEDYKTIYAFSSYITGINYVFPTGEMVKYSKTADFSKAIPIYSVETRVGKLSKYGDQIYNWRIDYLGTRGKTYITKDNNLTPYSTPRCVSSEYYFINSKYGFIGTTQKPEYDEEKTPVYDNTKFKEKFGGISVQQYTWWNFTTDYSGQYGDDIEGKYYLDFSDPVNKQIRTNTYFYPELMTESMGILIMEDGLNISDKTAELRESKKIEGNQFAFVGTWTSSSDFGSEYVLPQKRPYGITGTGKGVSFGVLKQDESQFDVTETDSEMIMNEDKLQYDTGSPDTYWDVDEEESAYLIENVTSDTFELTLILDYDGEDITLNKVELYYLEQGGSTSKDIDTRK